MSTPTSASALPWVHRVGAIGPVLAAVLLAGLAVSGCAQVTAADKVPFRKAAMPVDEPTALTLTGLNHPQPLPGSILSVTLLSVEDQRCPQDAQCLWAGMATVLAQVHQPGSPSVQLRLHSGVALPQAEPEQRWAFGLGFSVASLLPRPLSGKTVAPADWRVKLEVAPEDMPR